MAVSNGLAGQGFFVSRLRQLAGIINFFVAPLCRKAPDKGFGFSLKMKSGHFSLREKCDDFICAQNQNLCPAKYTIL